MEISRNIILILIILSALCSRAQGIVFDIAPDILTWGQILANTETQKRVEENHNKELEHYRHYQDSVMAITIQLSEWLEAYKASMTNGRDFNKTSQVYCSIADLSNRIILSVPRVTANINKAGLPKSSPVYTEAIACYSKAGQFITDFLAIVANEDTHSDGMNYLDRRSRLLTAQDILRNLRSVFKQVDRLIVASEAATLTSPATMTPDQYVNEAHMKSVSTNLQNNWRSK